MTKERLIELATEAITQNEIGDNLDLRYGFSDPDGTRSGKSGYSFGASQFDIENNWDAILCLRACGFRPKDMDRLFEQRGGISDLNTKLKAHSLVVDAWDTSHMEKTYKHCLHLLDEYGIRLESDEVMIHIMDYHNQFYFSPRGKLHRALMAHGALISSMFMLTFKMNHTAWGRKRSDDVNRRFRTIHKIYAFRGEHG